MNLRIAPLLLALGAGLTLPSTLGADDLHDLIDSGQVRIGVAEFAPWTFKNKDDQWEGFEIDVGRQLASDLGATPLYRVYSLEGLFDALENGEIDFIAAGLAITPERAIRVEFSKPYFASGTTVVTHRKLAVGVTEIEDLNREGVVIAVIEDSYSAELAAQYFDIATIKPLADASMAEKELVAGHAHAFLTNLANAGILHRRHGDLLDLPLTAPISRSVAGLAVKPGNQRLLNYLNAWIDAQQASGWLKYINNYWFNDDTWIHHLKD